MRGVIHVAGQPWRALYNVEQSALPNGAQRSVLIAVDTIRAPTARQQSVSKQSSGPAAGPNPGVPEILANGYSYSLCNGVRGRLTCCELGRSISTRRSR